MIDLHNHSNWSDGINNLDEIIIHKIKNNIEKVGITDHFDKDEKVSVTFNNLYDYLNELSQTVEKYKSEIKIYKGIESSIFYLIENFDIIPFDVINKFDYILIEYLDELNLNFDLKKIEKLFSKIKIKIGLAHTDLFKYQFKDSFLMEIINIIKSNNIFWELNINQRHNLYYNSIVNPNNNSDEIIDLLREKNIKVSLGSDCHNLSDYEYSKMKEGYKLIINKNLSFIDI